MENKKYTHLFFDLDRTLWDYERNAAEAIREILENYHSTRNAIEDVDCFLVTYERINEELWDAYGRNKITKEELRDKRFYLCFLEFGLDDYHTSRLVSDDFTQLAPRKPYLLPGAETALKYLKKKYSLGIISNGFEETQAQKMKHSGLVKYFDHVITSDSARAKKPHAKIFHHAMKLTGADPANSLMVGDHFDLDILAARDFGMDQVYYNPLRKKHEIQPTYTVIHHDELSGFL
ncbi:YjjG family noncanonical pyrimidine nucleotidase [bacterium]|nr:YjjG family noncanonical pyrimidine nucleotidase [bacterium]